MATALLIPLHLRADLNATLARLRLARTMGDLEEIRLSERRLDWLLQQIPRTETA
jgi:hypothetical protein